VNLLTAATIIYHLIVQRLTEHASSFGRDSSLDFLDEVPYYLMMALVT
jgi:hypothetical protein